MGRKAKNVVLPESEMQRLRAEFRAVFIKDDGWQAYLDGQPFNANPHAYDTDEQMTWAQGWMAAQACLKDSDGNPYNITITERT